MFFNCCFKSAQAHISTGSCTAKSITADSIQMQFVSAQVESIESSSLRGVYMQVEVHYHTNRHLKTQYKMGLKSMSIDGPGNNRHNKWCSEWIKMLRRVRWYTLMHIQLHWKH